VVCTTRGRSRIVGGSLYGIRAIAPLAGHLFATDYRAKAENINARHVPIAVLFQHPSLFTRFESLFENAFLLLPS
jgi:hypothetical protein